MLLVATSVQAADGRRAIGTYIPSRNADGSENPVVSTVLRGETYLGRAFVVNGFYITAYEPIYDSARRVIGALYAGTPQSEALKALRARILQIKIGKSGYVFAMNASGNLRGRYVISKNGQRDGENIWDAQDSTGRYFIREICAKALTLKPHETAAAHYRWVNPGDPAPRMKHAYFTYYKPWGQEAAGNAAHLSASFQKVFNQARQVRALVDRVAAFSAEQHTKVDQIRTALTQVQSEVQNMAASAQESASSAEELSAQAAQLDSLARDLTALLE